MSESLLVSEPVSVFTVLGSPTAEEPWYSNKWSSISKILDPLIDASRGSPQIQVMEIEGKKFCKFGKIGWNEQGHQKWTFESPQTQGFSTQRMFHSMKLSSPSWAICWNEKTPPDLLIAMKNGRAWYTDATFNPAFTLIVRTCLTARLSEPVKATVAKIADILDARLVATTERPFAVKEPKGGITDCFIDLANVFLLAPGDQHLKPPSVQILNSTWGSWSEISRNEP